MKKISIFLKLILSIPVIIGVITGGLFVGLGDKAGGIGLLYVIPALIVFLLAIWRNRKNRKKFIHSSLMYAAVSFYLVPVIAMFSLAFSLINNGTQYIELAYLAALLVGAISIMAGIPLAVLFHILASVYKYRTQ